MIELTQSFETAERESLKCVDANKHETTVAASKTRSQIHPHDALQVSRSQPKLGMGHRDHYIVQAVEENIPEILVVLEMSNAGNVVNWAILPKYVDHPQQQ